MKGGENYAAVENYISPSARAEIHARALRCALLTEKF